MPIHAFTAYIFLLDMTDTATRRELDDLEYETLRLAKYVSRPVGLTRGKFQVHPSSYGSSQQIHMRMQF